MTKKLLPLNANVDFFPFMYWSPNLFHVMVILIYILYCNCCGILTGEPGEYVQLGRKTDVQRVSKATIESRFKS